MLVLTLVAFATLATSLPQGYVNKQGRQNWMFSGFSGSLVSQGFPASFTPEASQEETGSSVPAGALDGAALSSLYSYEDSSQTNSDESKNVQGNAAKGSPIEETYEEYSDESTGAGQV